MHASLAGRNTTSASDVSNVIGTAMRRRHLVAAAHEMASIPDAFAHDTWMRLGSNRRERCGECSEQDEQYEFAHGSILQ
jgi:hypothetical protein